jgi:hypothetical protein
MLPLRAPGRFFIEVVLSRYACSPQWANRHLLPPLIDNKRERPKMTPRLTALVKRVTELRDTGLRECHYAKEFILR